MKIGHARIDITPARDSTFYLLGYKTPKRNEPALGIHDPIFCNAILMDNDGQQVFLLTADILELEDEMAADMKTRLENVFGIPRDRIILGALHDHSSIRDYHRNWEFGKYDPAWDAFMINTVERAYRECLDTMQEATARYGSKIITGYYSNRNHPGQPADNEIIIVRFYDTCGVPFAAIVNWAVHSTVLGGNNMYLTGDLAGNTCRKLGEKWGYYPVFVNGAAGDSSNRYDRLGSDFNELERASDGLSDAIAAIETSKEVGEGGVHTLTLSHEIKPDINTYHALLTKMLNDIKDGTLKPAGGLPMQHLVDKCEEQLKQPPFYLPITFQVIDFGALRFDVFPGELASQFGKQLKQAFNRPVIIAGYANGFHHYFLAKEDYGLSFETIGNPVPAGEPEKIIQKFLQAGKLLDLEEKDETFASRDDQSMV